jgi:hypothetical protein
MNNGSKYWKRYSSRKGRLRSKRLLKKGEYDYEDLKKDTWLWDKFDCWYKQKFFVYDGLNQIGVYYAKYDGEHLLKARAICKKLGKEIFIIEQNSNIGVIVTLKTTRYDSISMVDYIWYAEHGKKRIRRYDHMFILTLDKLLEELKNEKGDLKCTN